MECVRPPAPAWRTGPENRNDLPDGRSWAHVRRLSVRECALGHYEDDQRLHRSTVCPGDGSDDNRLPTWRYMVVVYKVVVYKVVVYMVVDVVAPAGGQVPTNSNVAGAAESSAVVSLPASVKLPVSPT
jgi:hypothetical protein